MELESMEKTAKALIQQLETSAVKNADLQEKLDRLDSEHKKLASKCSETEQELKESRSMEKKLKNDNDDLKEHVRKYCSDVNETCSKLMDRCE